MSEIVYRDPMTEEELTAYAEYLFSQIDDDQIFTDEAFNFLEDENNIPTEEDQIIITNMITEWYENASKNNGCDVQEKEEANTPEKATESPVAQEGEGQDSTSVEES